MRNLRPILLVEDDSVDAMTVKRAFGELKVVNELVRAINGEEALNYLREHLDRKPDRKSTRLNSSHSLPSRMPSSA